MQITKKTENCPSKRKAKSLRQLHHWLRRRDIRYPIFSSPHSKPFFLSMTLLWPPLVTFLLPHNSSFFLKTQLYFAVHGLQYTPLQQYVPLACRQPLWQVLSRSSPLHFFDTRFPVLFQWNHFPLLSPHLQVILNLISLQHTSLRPSLLRFHYFQS